LLCAVFISRKPTVKALHNKILGLLGTRREVQYLPFGQISALCYADFISSFHDYSYILYKADDIFSTRQFTQHANDEVLS
jgi:hypothetical protein